MDLTVLLKRLLKDQWSLSGLIFLVAYFGVAVFTTGVLPRWPSDPAGMQRAIRPFLSALGLAFVFVGTFFLSRSGKTSGGETDLDHNLDRSRAIVFLLLAIILTVFPAFTDDFLKVDRVIVSDRDLVGLSHGGESVWIEPFDSEITDVIGPMDLDGDGRSEVVVVTAPSRLTGDQRDGPASRIVILDRQTRRIRFDSRYVLLGQRLDPPGLALFQVRYRDIQFDSSDEPIGVRDVEGNVAHLQVRSDIYAAWSCDYPISQSHVGYEIAVVAAADLMRSGATQIVFAANPLRPGGVSLIGTLDAEGRLLGAYCHRGSILDLTVIEPQTQRPDFEASILVVLAENAALAEDQESVHSIFGLRGRDLMEPLTTSCWNMVTRSIFEDPTLRGTGCSLYQPAQLWYIWLSPPTARVESMQVNLYSVYEGKTGFSQPWWWVDMWLTDGCQMSVRLGRDAEKADIFRVPRRGCEDVSVEGVDDFTK